MDFCSISEMDQRIDFLVVNQTVDASGGVVSVSAPYIYPNPRPLWGKAEREKGSEKVEADKPTAQARATIQTRFVPGVVTTMLIVWQGIDWQITGIHSLPREDRLIISVSRRGESGDGDPR